MNCTECLLKKVKIVELVNGICPECKTDYMVLADVFSIPKSSHKKVIRKPNGQPVTREDVAARFK